MLARLSVESPALILLAIGNKTRREILTKTKDPRPNLIMKHTITLIPGDGIGPEVAANVVRIVEASGVEVEWETHYAGAQALEHFGETLPKDLLESIKRNGVALKGPVTTP